MDEEIARFMLLAAKFEFFLVNLNQQFAHVDGKTQVVIGVNWDKVAHQWKSSIPSPTLISQDQGFGSSE